MQHVDDVGAEGVVGNPVQRRVRPVEPNHPPFDRMTLLDGELFTLGSGNHWWFRRDHYHGVTSLPCSLSRTRDLVEGACVKGDSDASVTDGNSCPSKVRQREETISGTREVSCDEGRGRHEHLREQCRLHGSGAERVRGTGRRQAPRDQCQPAGGTARQGRGGLPLVPHPGDQSRGGLTPWPSWVTWWWSERRWPAPA